MSVHLFLISSDPSLCALAARAVTGLPIDLQTAQSQSQAQALLAGGARRAPLVLLVDLAGGGYLQTRQWVQQWAPEARAFFIAPPGEPAVWDADAAQAAELRAGQSLQILPRPADPRAQAELFGRILSEATALGDSAGALTGLDDLVGRSVAFRTALETATRAASHDQPLLLVGEPGTGKRLFARSIHAESPRAHAGFVRLECRALSGEALGADPFRAMGAQGAAAGHGLLREAAGGTLLLEEIGALDRRLQPGLARFIDETRLLQAQGADPRRSVRVFASTSLDLGAAVHAGEFHPELYQRLRACEVRVPPLRERPSDILLMAEHFLGRAVPRARGRGRFTLSDAVKQRLISYAWPGNVRELIAVLQVAGLNAEGCAQIDIRHLPDGLLGAAPVKRKALPGPGEPSVQTRGARIGTVDADRGTRFTSGSIVVELPEEGASFEEMERAILRAAMARTRGNVVRAARLLRLGRGSLRYRLEKYGLAEPRRRGSSRRASPAGKAREDALPRAS